MSLESPSDFSVPEEKKKSRPSFIKKAFLAGTIAVGALAAEGCDENGDPITAEPQRSKQVEGKTESRSEKEEWRKVARMEEKQNELDEVVGILKMNDIDVPDLRNTKYHYTQEMGKITEITIEGKTYYISDEDRAEFKKFKESF